MAVSDFEINIRREDIDEYTVETRFLEAGSQADTRFVSSPIKIDLRSLIATQLDSDAYGQLLSKILFEDSDLDARFREALAVTEKADGELHVRIFVEPNARELHRVRWETLVTRDSNQVDADHHFLFLGEKVFLSRYLTSRDYRSIRLRSRADLKALVAVAAPDDAATFSPNGVPLGAVDAAKEFELASAGLGNLAHRELGRAKGAANPAACTLDRLAKKLSAGYDILYLVCHGALVKGEPLLLLEREDGKGDLVSGRQFVDRIRDLRNPPTLVILASCQSAGAGTKDDGALSSIGPRLAEAGIPAVIAMQGNVTMVTASTFIGELFRELRETGQVHRSAAVARGRVREQPDWWSPVLFTRLRNGEVWYKAGFGTEAEEFDRWPSLLASIASRNCTPILGPALSENIMGTPYNIAGRLSQTHHYPLAPEDSHNLPRVCQFLSATLGPGSVARAVIEARCAEALERNPDVGAALEPPDKNAAPERLIDYYNELVERIWEHRQLENKLEAHTVLASYPFRTFVTTSDHSVLERALARANKKPQSAICPWSDKFRDPSSSALKPGSDPEPIVYHLFGHSLSPESLVITEDDYFDFLIGAASNRDQIVRPVGRALTNAALLFLGFEIDSWDFRVLFRGLMSYEGRALLARHPHVAVQLDLEQGQVQEPEATRRFLTDSFGTLNVTIFWGSVEDFTARLAKGV
jgi:hypothetical protein